jgi:hypothetical protein
MFHTLGSPDLYRYYNGTIDPVGSWDLMCGNASPPQSTMAWMKYKYGGWVESIPAITETGTYTLHNVWSDTNNAYKIASPNSSTEFFVVEYRNKSVYWDSGLPGSGLLIYRINTLVGGNADGPPDEVYVFRPGGTNTTTNGYLYYANFSSESGRTVFNNTSDPPCFLSNNQPGGIHIRNVGASGGETMTFEVVFPGLIVDPITLDFNNIKVGTTSTEQIVTISGESLTGNITYTKEGNDATAFDIDEISWNPTTGGTLSVTFSPTVAKDYNATITIKSAGVSTKIITLKGKGVIPTIIVSSTELDFDDVNIGNTSTVQFITVSGTGLMGDITYIKEGTDSTAFDIDEVTWDEIGGGMLGVTFSPTEIRTYNATITFSNADTEDKTVTLKGNGTNVAINDPAQKLSGITICPNPTTGELRMESGEWRVESVEIFDVMGNLSPVPSPNWRGLPEGRGEVNISHLSSGIYFIRIQTENGVITRKVVKQ